MFPPVQKFFQSIERTEQLPQETGIHVLVHLSGFLDLIDAFQDDLKRLERPDEVRDFTSSSMDA